MSNMTVGDRNALERAAHSSDQHMRLGAMGRRALAVYVVVAAAILAALTWAAVQIFDGWSHAFVVADLLIFTGAIAFFARARRDPRLEQAADEGPGWQPRGF